MIIHLRAFKQSHLDTAETLTSDITRNYNEAGKQFMAEGTYFTCRFDPQHDNMAYLLFTH